MSDFPHTILNVASPTECAAQGKGMTIKAGITESPFGLCLIGEVPRGICHLSFFDDGGEEQATAEMQARWPLAALHWDHNLASKIAGCLFTRQDTDGKSNPPWNLFVRGTPFQVRIWRMLLTIPQGMRVSYGKLAKSAGNPKAARATGSAVGQNTIAFLIPCHRVIRADGMCGHYRWGALRKQRMLAWETANHSGTKNRRQ